MTSKARLLDRGFWHEDTRLLLPRLCGDCVMITLISHPALPGNVFGCGQSAVRGRGGPPAAPHQLALHGAGGRHGLLLVPEKELWRQPDLLLLLPGQAVQLGRGVRPDCSLVWGGGSEQGQSWLGGGMQGSRVWVTLTAGATRGIMDAGRVLAGWLAQGLTGQRTQLKGQVCREEGNILRSQQSNC